jgi:hypothetical protein
MKFREGEKVIAKTVSGDTRAVVEKVTTTGYVLGFETKQQNDYFFTFDKVKAICSCQPEKTSDGCMHYWHPPQWGQR